VKVGHGFGSYQNDTEADDLESGILILPAKLLKGLYWEYQNATFYRSSEMKHET